MTYALWNDTTKQWCKVGETDKVWTTTDAYTGARELNKMNEIRLIDSKYKDNVFQLKRYETNQN